MKKLILMFIFLSVLVSCDTNKITYDTQRSPEVVFEEGKRTTYLKQSENTNQARGELSKYLEFIEDKNFVYNDVIEQDPIVTLLESDACQRTYYCKVYDGYTLEVYAYKSDSLNMISYFVYDFAGYKYYEYNIRSQEPYVPYRILNLKENWESKFGCKFDYNTEEYSGVVDNGTKCDSMYRSEIEFWLDKSNAISGITNKKFDFVENNTIDKKLVDQYREKLIEYIDTNYLK